MPSGSRRRRSRFSGRRRGRRRSSTGRLRLSSSDWFGTVMLSPVIAAFGKRHPKVIVELLTDARLYSLPRREADLVFRIKPFDEPEVISRKLLHIPYALYGKKGSKPPRAGDGSGVRIVTMNAEFADMPDAVWLKRTLPKAEIASRSNNRQVQAELCAGGGGARGAAAPARRSRSPARRARHRREPARSRHLCRLSPRSQAAGAAARAAGSGDRADGGMIRRQSLVLPDGQNTQTFGQSTSPEIFHFTEIRKRRMCRHSGPRKRGVSRSSRTWAGRRWTWVTSARRVLQGGQP